MTSTKGVTIRRGAMLDVEHVQRLGKAAVGAAQWKAAVYESYTETASEEVLQRCLLVALDGEHLLAFVAGSYLPGDAEAEVENLAVAEEWRRRGVARMLCERLKEWARARGAQGLGLEVRSSNVAAQSLYAGLGFMPDGRRVNYYRDPIEDALRMVWMFR